MSKLSEKAMLSCLNISQWSARRLDRKITDEVNQSHGAVADAGRYNKLLIDKAAIEPIQKVVSEARLLHVEMTQPWADVGPRLLPAALYLKYAEKLDALKAKFNAEVAKFIASYPAHVARRRADLNGLFREEDYPSERELPGLFKFDVQIFPCPDADDFRVELAQEHAEDIRRDIERRMQDAMEEAMKEPVRRIVAVVGRMAERLGSYKPAVKGKNEKGKACVVAEAENTFRDSLVDNVRELAELLPAFNLKGDKALADLTRRIERELTVEDAKDLRENELARKAVAQSAEDILKHAQALLG